MTRQRALKTLTCKKLFGVASIAISIAFSAPAMAKKKRELRKTEAAPSFIDITHDTISNKILGFANQIDSFFGDERIDEETNNTRLRLYTQWTAEEAAAPENETGYRFQLRLPRTEKRLQLIVQRDVTEDSDEPGQQLGARAGSTGARERLEDSPTAGFRYLLDVADISFSSAVGIRINKWPPQIYYRARFRKNINFGDWIFRPVEKLLWVDREGWFSRTNLNFDNKLNDSWLFRYVNQINWDDQDYILYTQTGPTWYQKISDKTGIQYSALTYFEDTPKWAVQNYAVGASFRQLIYKEWFFWEITPVVNFPRENAFRRIPEATMKFEVIFGRI